MHSHGKHVIGWHDLQFVYKPTLCRYPSGGLSRRWMPAGMPRLNRMLEHSAIFLFSLDPATGKITGPDGTGMIIGRLWNTIKTRYHYYAVTHRHVLDIGASIIQINTENGKSRQIETEPHEWFFIPDTDDLAVCDITDQINEQEDDIITYIAESTFLTKDFIESRDIGMGEDVFMIGLFIEHPGKGKNVPLGRFGNLSRLADEQSPVEQNGNLCPSHLVDMRSRAGCSGSPVFVYRTPFSDLSRNGAFTGQPVHPGDYFLKFLGVHCAQFPEEMTFRKAESRGDIIKEGDKLMTNSSITVVIPAWQISKIIDLPHFNNRRKEREERFSGDINYVPVPE